MRVLHLSPEAAPPAGWHGGATRQYHLLRRLVQLGHDVTVVAPVPSGEQGLGGEFASAGIRLAAPARRRRGCARPSPR